MRQPGTIEIGHVDKEDKLEVVMLPALKVKRKDATVTALYDPQTGKKIGEVEDA